MDCREFCDQHVAYVDDTLAGIELVRMQRHMAECDSCAKHDAKIRRSLLLFRNLPPIQPSPDFSERLEARLRREPLQEDLLA
jgi:anti-sigma factor RsiW